jgi:plastocyanin
MIKGYSPTPLFCGFSFVIAYILVIIFSPFASNPLTIAFAQAGANQPDINAASVFDTGQMVLPKSVKHLVILIPDEAHHGPGEEDESRFIAQPFVPQNAVVSTGTQIAWFSGDVGHEHNVVVRDSSNNQLFETGEFAKLAASKPIVFNNTGNFDYADTVEYEEGFVMTGNITVNGQENSAGGNTNSFDTVGTLMVPSMMVQSVADEMRRAGFGIDSMHNFKDLRGGQEDTGDEQVLVVWTTAGKSLDDVTSQLGEISEGLPYE